MKQLLAFLLILFSITANGQQNPVGIFEGHTDVGTGVKPGLRRIYLKQDNTLYPGPVIMYGPIMMNFNLYGRK